MNSIFSKRTVIFLTISGIVLLLVVVGIVVLNVYFIKPVEVVDLKDPNSELLNVITCNEVKILSSNWHWHTTGKFQAFKNNFEYVLCSFAGYFQDSQFASLDYSLEKHSDKIEINQDSVITNDFQADGYFDLDLKTVSEKQFSKCAQNNQRFSCLVLAQYGESVLSIRFIGQNGMPLANVEALFNSLLTSLDASIRAQ